MRGSAAVRTPVLPAPSRAGFRQTRHLPEDPHPDPVPTAPPPSRAAWQAAPCDLHARHPLCPAGRGCRMEGLLGGLAPGSVWGTCCLRPGVFWDSEAHPEALYHSSCRCRLRWSQSWSCQGPGATTASEQGQGLKTTQTYVSQFGGQRSKVKVLSGPHA